MQGTCLAQTVEYMTLDIGVMSSSPTLEVEPTLKKQKTFNALGEMANFRSGGGEKCKVSLGYLVLDSREVLQDLMELIQEDTGVC